MVRPRKMSEGSTGPDASAFDTMRARRETEAAERLTDILVQLAAARVRETMDPMDPAHARYWEWRAKEAREALSPAERVTLRADAEAFARTLALKRAALDAGARAARDSAAPGLVPGAPAEHAAPRLTGTDAWRAAIAARCALRFDLAVAAGSGRELWDEPATSWVELPAGVPDGRHVALAVHGDSMEPLLHAGDTLLVRLDERATAGDVIVAYRPEHGHVVKRVAAIVGDRLILESVNTAYDTLDVPNGPGTVVGTVVLRWCRHMG